MTARTDAAEQYGASRASGISADRDGVTAKRHPHPAPTFDTAAFCFDEVEVARVPGGTGGLVVDPDTRTISVPTTCIEHAYGATSRLSFQIKVF